MPSRDQADGRVQKNAPVSKRQRRNPLRYHSHCRYSGPSTAGNGRVRPGLLPEGFGGKLRGDTSPRRAACFHHPQALLGRGPWILVLVIAFFRYLPYNTPFSGICQARKRLCVRIRRGRCHFARSTWRATDSRPYDKLARGAVGAASSRPCPAASNHRGLEHDAPGSGRP